MIRCIVFIWLLVQANCVVGIDHTNHTTSLYTVAGIAEHRYCMLTGWVSLRSIVCCHTPSEAEAEAEAETEAETEARIASRAREVIVALANHDMQKFAEYVHPELGVRFSPCAYVQLDQDIVIQAEQIRTATADKKRRLWGYADGTGDAIEMTFSEYFDVYVYNRGYVDVEDIGYNTRIGIGNTIDNSLEVYSAGYVVEYYSQATDPEGMSWSSLRVVFIQIEGVSYVVGLIHDQWTI